MLMNTENRGRVGQKAPSPIIKKMYIVLGILKMVVISPAGPAALQSSMMSHSLISSEWGLFWGLVRASEIFLWVKQCSMGRTPCHWSLHCDRWSVIVIPPLAQSPDDHIPCGHHTTTTNAIVQAWTVFPSTHSVFTALLCGHVGNHTNTVATMITYCLVYLPSLLKSVLPELWPKLRLRKLGV